MKPSRKARREPRPAAHCTQMREPIPTANQTLPEILAAARAVVSQALPLTFQIGGKTFWLTVGIDFAQVKIFATPDKTAPIAKQVFSAMPIESPAGTTGQHYRISVLPLRRL